MEKRTDDRGVEQTPDLPDVPGGTVSEGNEPEEWQEFGTGDPAFFIKASDDE